MTPLTQLIHCSKWLLVSTLLITTSGYTQHYTADNGWYFRNFDTPELSWEKYRDTFIGIPPTKEHASSGFDLLFYEYVYKSELSSSGNCYGMSLMSLMILKKGGHMGFCAPCSQYPGDNSAAAAGPDNPRLYYAINLMHGHQVHLPSLRLYLDLLARGKTRDGQFAYDQFKYYEAMDDPCIVNITKSLSPTDGGHTIAAYQGIQVGGEKRLYVYDPNRTWYIPSHRSWYEAGSNYIAIQADGTWSFEMAGGDVWTGNPASGGNIVIAPISIAGPRSRTVSSMGLDALSFLNEFFIYGSGNDLNQVTDSKGKKLFKPGTKEIDNDPNTGMLNIVPWYPSDGTPPYNFQSYFQIGNPGGPIHFDVSSTNGYRLDVAGLRGHLIIEAIGGAGIDRVTIENLGMTSPKVMLANKIKAERFDIKFANIIQSNVETREFYLKNLVIPPDTQVELSIANNQNAIQALSPASNLVFDLEINQYRLGKINTIQLPKLQIISGQQTIIQPENWQIFNPDNFDIITRPILIDQTR